ncbi:MAG: type II toxin-antitoxin system ParD family antitoxin [Gemmataceae bacterium]
MNVSLTPGLERMIQAKVESGMYQTASEVVRGGLRLLGERDELRRRKLEELRREIQLGIDEADKGLLEPFDEKVVEDAKARGRQRRAGKVQKP